MNVVNLTKSLLLDIGSSPVLYLMIGLSVGSIAVILERAWVFAHSEEDLDALDRDLFTYLESSDLVAALARLGQSSSPAALILSSGLKASPRGRKAAAAAMNATATLERLRLERRLSLLGTLGANAPFIGLLGTVIGIVMAFDTLAVVGPGGAPQGAVMSAIAEALVATAVGLVVAIPAVVAFNAFQRRIKVLIGEAEALGQKLLSFVPGEEA